MWIRWRRAPRSFLKVSLAAIAVLVVALGLLGWQLLDQDRKLERQQVQERLDHAAELSVAMLQQGLSATEDRLATLAAAASFDRAGVAVDFSIQNQDAVVVVTTSDGLWSSAPLVFQPDQPDPVDAVAASFAETERLELSGQNLPVALARFRELAASADPQVRAGAWLRAARVARKLQQPRVALAAYTELGRLGSVPAAGRPADLVATLERCALLDRNGQAADLKAAADELAAGLRAGRWRLSRGEYLSHLEKLRAWQADAGDSIGPPDPAGTPAEALATGLALVWRDEPGVAASAGPVTGRRILDADGTPILVLWRRAAGRMAAIASTPAHAARTWFKGLPAVADRQRVRVTLESETGQTWLGPSRDAAFAVRRSPSDSSLPFAVRVATSDPAGDTAIFSGRRRLLASVLGTLGLLLVVGGYVVARGVGKELEVARLQSDFVAAVSHEFRTPVASVKQLSELLDDGRVQDEGRRAQYYGLLRRESDRLQRLVEGLLDFDRMESSAKEYRFEVIEPWALVRSVADEFAAGTGNGSHRIVVSVAEALPAIRADREALGRAIWNLVDNAAKYSPADTAINIDASLSERVLLINVRDEGPGIAPEEQHRIFDKFVRGASARETGAKGTGLGLAMVSHIVLAHGGEVRVSSRPGAGSTFTIALPVEGSVV
jgi:signal transduction histidine kinase